ncbi:formate dehydrogenase alpha subunit [Desulfacinum hydrothermale DSM 13146]|uniref:Formate dehydrogenase alpha subunit n=1 Tax=Desulfacinum hydrothermale DSM 13146 TaxID=1121390 RepID=A0A1W1X934_9BACT|nr:molybdopterin-dependent oxidoreductase [Desulfacinum hydrothermale]SMC20347.1 formate dehydrogenase alpha subunit [Desulfacinum hydrothermale DSM 13146]
MITVTINGKAYEAQPGMTVMQVADANGIRIPRLCYHKALSPIGACRICVVEVKPGPPRPVPACTTPVADKMQVVTESETLTHYRRELLQLLLINHPLDCPICDKGGECELQNLTRELKISQQPYQAAKLTPQYDSQSPLIERYPDRCVNCERCVRVCRDWVGAAALYFDNRGYRTAVTAGGRVMDCEFCGSCIGVCPTGAIIDKTFKYSARAWQLQKEAAVCPYCGGGCHLVLETKKGQLKRVTASFDEPVNGGIICSRGRFSLDIVQHERRLTEPLIRKDGELRPVAWEEALDFVADRIREIGSRHGPFALAGIGSARATNESNYVFQKFCRAVLGTAHVDTTAALDHQKILRALVHVLGRPRVTWADGEGTSHRAIREVSGFQLALGTLDDLDRADTVLVVGSDVKKEMPPLVWRINQAQKRKSLRELLIVSSRHTRFRSSARWSGTCRPGGAGFVILGILKGLFETGGEKLRGLGDFRREEVLRRRLDATKWDLVQDATGLDRERMVFLADRLLTAERPSLVVGYDLAGLGDGYDAACYVADLLLVLGKKLKLHLTAEKANTQGCSDMGVSPHWLPGYAPLEDADRFEAVWKMEVPRDPGLTLAEIVAAAAGEGPSPIRGLWMVGTDLFGTSLNRSAVEAALERLELLVCQEAFLNPTAAMAHVVFPARLAVETEGSLTSGELRVQRQEGKTFASGPRDDWEILCEVARRLGRPMEYASAAQIFSEICQVFPHYDQYGLPDIPAEGFWWNRLYRTKYGSMGWRRVLDPSLKAVIPWLEMPPQVSEEYPFLLLVSRSLFQSGTLSRYGLGARTLEPQGLAWLHPQDARDLQVKEGERIRVASASGSITAPVGLDRRVPRRTVQASLHFQDLPVQRLTDGGIVYPVRVIPTAEVEPGQG